MKRFLCGLAALLLPSSIASASALFSIPGGTTVTTTLTAPSTPGDIGLYNLGNITTWNIKLPPSPIAGQVVNIVCGGGSVTTINLSTTDSSTVVPSVTTCSSGANSYLQYLGPSNQWVQTIYGSSVSAGVSSIANSDGTLTISPTTGAAVASLALAHANSWSAIQTFAAGDISLTGATTGCATFTGTILSSTGVACGSGGGGGVTSVNAAGTGIFSFTGGPVTTTGTLTLTQAGTSGGVPYFSGASTLSSSGALTANAIVIGGGTGAAPTTITAPAAAGDLFYWNGTAYAKLPGNASGTQYLQETSSGVPSWTTPSGSGGITIGTTSISGGCTTGYNLYNNGGVVGCQANGGGSSTITMGTTATASGAANQLIYDTGSVVQETSYATITNFKYVLAMSTRSAAARGFPSSVGSSPGSP